MYDNVHAFSSSIDTATVLSVEWSEQLTATLKSKSREEVQYLSYYMHTFIITRGKSSERVTAAQMNSWIVLY